MYSERPITGRKYVRISACPAIGRPVDNNLLQSVRLSDRLNAPGRPIEYNRLKTKYNVQFSDVSNV